MSTSTTTQLEFKANTGQAQQDIKSLGNEVKNAGNETQEASGKSAGFNTNLTKLAAGAAAAAVVVKKVADAAKECIDAYAIQQEAEVKLQATMESTGNAIGFTFQQYKDLASEIQSNTTFGDEAVLEAERILMAFGNLNEEGFVRTLELSADMAAAMGIDIATAAQQLGKALVEPGEGLNRLKSYGIAFSEEEENLIKSLTDAGDAMGAQEVILAAVEKRYKGVAEAIADTDTGKLTQIKNVWGDIKENLGQSILQSVSPALDKLLDTLNRISEWTAARNMAGQINEGLQTGDVTDLSTYSNLQLEEALKKYGIDIFGDPAKMEAYTALSQEIQSRGGKVTVGGMAGKTSVEWLASGGIVNGPTPAIVGEAGPEAVIPLDSPQGRQLTGGGVNVNITVEGNADEQKIYEAIEAAQRTGLLPAWSH